MDKSVLNTNSVEENDDDDIFEHTSVHDEEDDDVDIDNIQTRKYQYYTRFLSFR